MEMSLRQDTVSSRRINITELARLSGVSASTIHNYLNMWLLHPPKKLGLSLSVYDWTHLSKLKRIIELRENKKLPLSSIKKILSQENTLSGTASQESEAKSLISALEEEKRVTRAQKSEMRKIEIIDAAIALFSKNGYEKTTLEAIADLLHMAKSTVYLYFESKEDLFMECIKRLTVVAVPEEDWDDIRKERDSLRKLKKRGISFLRAFPSYKGILTMTKAALGGNNQKLAEKAENTLSLMTRPVAKDLRRGMADGIFRQIDGEIVSHLILAMGEGLGCRLMMDSHYTIEQGNKIMFDFVTHGIMKHEVKEEPKLETALCSGEVTDLKGVMTRVKNILFRGKSYLTAKIGEAEVKIDPVKVDKIKFLHQDSLFWAEIKSKDGQMMKVEVDSAITLSGNVSLGKFYIELNNVDTILLEH